MSERKEELRKGGQLSFDCAQCGKSYGRKVRLVRHLSICHSKDPKRHVCSEPGCKAKYSRPDHLKRHLESAHNYREKLICIRCESEFASGATLEKHQRSHERRIFRCQWDGCRRAFLKHQHLRTHQYVHTGLKPFVCEKSDCNRRFLLPSQLRHHQKVHRGYPCRIDSCEQTFNVWSDLRKHVGEAHRLEHRCSVCSKTFKERRSLRKHEGRHQCEVSCPVSDCNIKLQPRYLNGHLKKFHQSDNNSKLKNREKRKLFSFKCSVGDCGKLFFRIHHLKRHMSEVHNKVKYEGNSSLNPIQRTSQTVRY